MPPAGKGPRRGGGLRRRYGRWARCRRSDRAWASGLSGVSVPDRSRVIAAARPPDKTVATECDVGDRPAADDEHVRALSVEQRQLILSDQPAQPGYGPTRTREHGFGVRLHVPDELRTAKVVDLDHWNRVGVIRHSPEPAQRGHRSEIARQRLRVQVFAGSEWREPAGRAEAAVDGVITVDEDQRLAVGRHEAATVADRTARRSRCLCRPARGDQQDERSAAERDATQRPTAVPARDRSRRRLCTRPRRGAPVHPLLERRARLKVARATESGRRSTGANRSARSTPRSP
jgi:hypothetical protein